MQQPIVIDVLGCRFTLTCSDPVSRRILAACYAPFLANASTDDGTDACEYVIDATANGWRLLCEALSIPCPSLADLLYDFEKDMTVRVQLARPDLLFIHGAVVAQDNAAVVIAGRSGAGKSTLCWALCHHGFGYLSDELAPVNTKTGIVETYPRALCLKHRPGQQYALPGPTIDAGRTLHVPANVFPNAIVAKSRRLAAMIFVDPDSPAGDPYVAESMTPGEAAARLYANSLNQLAHERYGLSAVTELATSVAAVRLPRTELAEMVRVAGTVLN